MARSGRLRANRPFATRALRRAPVKITLIDRAEHHLFQPLLYQWLVIHIGFMTGFRNRFGAVASWWFAFTRDLRRERTFTSRDVGVIRDVYGEDLTTMVAATNTAGPPAPPDPAGSAGPGKPARGRQ